MNKILVVIFDDETAAYKGLSALKDIHKGGDITLYAATVIKKDSLGAISIKETVDEGPVGIALGTLTGSIIGLLGGPTGAIVGGSLGGLTGALSDLWGAGIDIEFANEVSSSLTPGRAAVVADVEETWVIPINTKMEELGGEVYRRLRSEVIEDQLVRDYTAFDDERKQLEAEWNQATIENKTAIQKHIDKVKKKIMAIQDQAEARVEKLSTGAQAKIASLREQMKQATESQKAKIEKRITDIKADFNARSTKLKQANILIKEAFSV